MSSFLKKVLTEAIILALSFAVAFTAPWWLSYGLFFVLMLVYGKLSFFVISAFYDVYHFLAAENFQFIAPFSLTLFVGYFLHQKLKKLVF